MKPSRKIGIGTICAVVVAVIMVTSTAGLPIMNKEAIDNQEPQSQQMTDLTIIDKCWEYYNEPSFRTRLVEVQNSIDVEINKLPEQDRQIVRDLFQVDDTFSLSGIQDRISSLKVNSVLYDVQDLIGVYDNYDEYNATRQGSLEKILELFYNNNFEKDTMGYPIIEFIGNILGYVSLLWEIPLLFLGGLTGLILAAFLTFVFFSPFIIPAGLYVGIVECFENDEEFKEDIVDIAVIFGLVGLVLFGSPLILEYMFGGGWGMLGITYVLSTIILSGLDTTKGGYTRITSEVAPNGAVSYHPQECKVGKPFLLNTRVRDDDEVFSGGFRIARDYLQVGFDWDNDFNVDEWFKLKREDEGWINLDVYHTWYEPGVHKYNFVTRDLWGVYGDWINLEVTVERARSKQVELLGNFPLLTRILERLGIL